MTTIEKITIGFVVVVLLAFVAQLYVCFPYLLKPISEAPLLCVGNKTGVVITTK